MVNYGIVLNLRIVISISLLMLVGCVAHQAVPVEEKPKIQNKYSIGVPEFHPKQLYPRSMFEIQQDGWVLLKVDIDAGGRTKNIRVVDYSPSEDFVRVAINYVSGTKYKEHTKVNRPPFVKDHLLLVKFKIHSDV